MLRTPQVKVVKEGQLPIASAALVARRVVTRWWCRRAIGGVDLVGCTTTLSGLNAATVREEKATACASLLCWQGPVRPLAEGDMLVGLPRARLLQPRVVRPCGVGFPDVQRACGA